MSFSAAICVGPMAQLHRSNQTLAMSPKSRVHLAEKAVIYPITLSRQVTMSGVLRHADEAAFSFEPEEDMGNYAQA
jgi:hypothetical protein